MSEGPTVTEYGVLVTAKVPKDKKKTWLGDKEIMAHLRVTRADADAAKQSAEFIFGNEHSATLPSSVKAHYAYPMNVPVQVMTPDEAEAAGYATYNGCPHVCVEAAPDQTVTVSIKLPGGLLFTACVLPGGKGLGYTECVDVQLHGTGKEWDNNGTKIPEFQTFQFRRGRMVADTRKEDMATTVVLLANPGYYKA